jgi:hypothetical protein
VVEPEPYQWFDTPQYSYRVLVTDLDAPIDMVVGFYRQRAGAENLIQEAHNAAGLAAHPSARWSRNCVHFQLAMLAYNLNCWWMRFHREEPAKVADLHHTTLVTARLRYLVPGGQNRAACRRRHGAVQRSLRGERHDGAANGPVTFHRR